MRRLLAFLLLLAPAARADCPTAADMASGVEVAFSDGTSVVLSRAADGRVRAEAPARDGLPAFRSVLAQGFWEVEAQEVAPEGEEPQASHLVMHYPVEPEALPAPAPGLRWTGWATPQFEGMLLRSDTLSLRVGAPRPLVLGDCRWEVWPVTVAVKRATEAAERRRHLFLPELGAAVDLGGEADGAAPVAREVVAISRAGR